MVGFQNTPGLPIQQIPDLGEGSKCLGSTCLSMIVEVYFVLSQLRELSPCPKETPRIK